MMSNALVRVILLATMFLIESSVSAHAAGQATLGVIVRPVSQQYAQFFSLKNSFGAQVVTVVGASALQPGDVILKVNDSVIQKPADLPAIVKMLQPGDVVSLDVLRGQERHQFNHSLQSLAGTSSSLQTVRPGRPTGIQPGFPIVASDRFEQEVLSADQPVLVYFLANWCSACKFYLAAMQQLREQHPEIKFVAVDVDKSSDIVNRYGIARYLPALILFNGGKELDKLMPMQSKEQVVGLLEKLRSGSDEIEMIAPIGREGWIKDVSFIRGSQLLAARNDSQTVFIWDYQRGALLRMYRALVSGLSTNGAYTALSDLKLTSISLIDNLTQSQRQIAADQYIEKLAVSPQGTAVASFGINRNGSYGIRIVGSDNRLLRQIAVDKSTNTQSVKFAFSPDGLTFAVATAHKLEFYNTVNWQPETIVQLTSPIYFLDFTSDSRAVLAKGSRDELIDLQGKRVPWRRGIFLLGNPQERFFAAFDSGKFSFTVINGRAAANGARFEGHRSLVSVGAVNESNGWVATGSNDGTVRLWDQSSGKEAVQLVGFYNGEWIAITPDGYYNSSVRGHELLSVRRGRSVFGVDQFYDVFYRPDIVSAKLQGQDISGLVTVTVEDAIKSPPPVVTFAPLPQVGAAEKVAICYQVRSSGGGIGEVRLFQNGKLVKSDGFYREASVPAAAKPLQLAKVTSHDIHQGLRSLTVKGKQPSGAVVRQTKGESLDECVELEPVAGENEVSLAAFNAPNTVQSRMATARFNSTRPAAEPRLYILAIGIDRYRDASINLKYAAKDASDFIRLLADKAATLYKPENIHLISLLNEQAGKQQVLSTIERLAAQVRHGDSFVFFTASHGLLMQNQYYIVTSSFSGRLDAHDGLISSNEIVEMSKKIKSLSQLFIFDTCHAGGVDTIISGLYDARMSVLAKKMGLHIFASAGSLQTALDGYNGNGLYTYSLLEGMRSGSVVDKQQSGKVTVKGLGRYSQERTSLLSAQLGHPQTPAIISFGKDSVLFEVR